MQFLGVFRPFFPDFDVNIIPKHRVTGVLCRVLGKEFGSTVFKSREDGRNEGFF